MRTPENPYKGSKIISSILVAKNRIKQYDDVKKELPNTVTRKYKAKESELVIDRLLVT